MKLYCAVSLPHLEKTLLREHLRGIVHVFSDELEAEQRLPEFLQSDICFGNIPPAWVGQTRRLRWLQLDSAGFGEYQQVDQRPDLVITNLGGFYAVPVAESALAGILALYRGMQTLTLLQGEKKWIGQALRPRLKTLFRAKVLILGGGAIGRHLIKLLEAFEAAITVFGRRPAGGVTTDPAELDRVLPAMDVVVSCLPETEETIGLIDERRLNLLAPHALFINVGRGSVVDEAALIALLQGEKIGGCVLDVTQREPLPPDNPLWTAPHTLLTQHTGGGFDEEHMDKVRAFLDNLERFRVGGELLNVVELARGY